MKKIIAIIVAVIAVSFVAEAQIPKPPTGEINDTKGRRNGVVRVRSEAVNSGPIGTATALLLSLGAGAVAYKVNKNKRK